MDNKSILDNMVKYGYNNLYLELSDEEDVYTTLEEKYGMTEKDICNSNFRIADEVLQVTRNPRDQESVDDKSTSRSEKYQLWMDILLIALFGAMIIVLIFQPIPNVNNELLVILATWLAKDVSTIVHYYHGTSFGSLLKTKSMIRKGGDDYENH